MTYPMPWGIGDVPRPGTRRDGRPLLFLDIDGVLSPAAPSDPESYTEHTVDDVLRFRVSVRYGAWLGELARHYELVWASTWEHLANEHLGPLLGLPELPVVEFSAYERQQGDPRHPVVQLFEMRKWAPILRYADGRPFAWVDDVIPVRIRRQAWPYRGILLVPVDPEEGLTRPDVDRLLAWAVSGARRR